MESKDLSKYIYTFWKESNWNTSKLTSIKNAVGIKDNDTAIKVLRRSAKKYAIEVLGITEDDFYTEIEKYKGDSGSGRRTKNKYFKFFEMLSDIDDDENIIKLVDDFINNNNTPIAKIEDKMRDYVIIYRRSEDNLIAELHNKIQIYKQYKNEIRLKEKQKNHDKWNKDNIETARNFINSYINSDCDSKSAFCERIKLSSTEFDKYIELIKECDSELYDSYRQKGKQNSDKGFAIIIDDVMKVLEGIKDNNIDLVDYYLITNSHFSSLSNFDKASRKVLSINKITKQDYGLIKKFLIKNASFKEGNTVYRDLPLMRKSEIMKTKDMVGIKFDEYGNYDESDARIITDNEKEDIINFLNDHNIPINRVTYYSARKRLLEGEILSSNNKKKK